MVGVPGDPMIPNTVSSIKRGFQLVVVEHPFGADWTAILHKFCTISDYNGCVSVSPPGD